MLYITLIYTTEYFYICPSQETTDGPNKQACLGKCRAKKTLFSSITPGYMEKQPKAEIKLYINRSSCVENEERIPYFLSDLLHFRSAWK